MIIRTYYRKNIVLVASYINMKVRSKFIANNVIFNINDFFLLHCFLLPIFFSVNFGNTMQDFFFPYNCLLVGIVFLKEHSRITKGICLGIEVQKGQHSRGIMDDFQVTLKIIHNLSFSDQWFINGPLTLHCFSYNSILLAFTMCQILYWQVYKGNWTM